MVLDYFHNLFSAEDKEQSMADIPREFPTLSCEQKIKLTKPFSKEEVKIAIFEMSPFKALGANGIHAGFYQNLWEVVGDSVCNFAMRFFETGSLPHGVNDTILDLVPKVLHPETLTQLRLISLCNVGYKAMTKTITNRLKELMGSIIAPSQSSFVPGRNILDNILIYQEVLHSMRTKNIGKGFMTIKIDLEKAHDRLSWSFIRATLQRLHLPPSWVQNIMQCVETTRMAI